MPTPAPLLELDRVSRDLGGRPVLHEVSLRLDRGEVVGLLGANGAGKSTTLSIIAGVLATHSGSVRIDGVALDAAPRRARAQIGWVPEAVVLWPELTVVQALGACTRLRGLPRAVRGPARERELARLDLEDIAHRLCGQLSLGQQRRVGLAQALLHEPSLLVLDEPGNGLDPLQAAQWRGLVGQLAPGRGIILSSHDLAEVAATCNRAVILHEGRVRHDAPLDGKAGALAERFRAIAGAPLDAAA